jgi:hypothetical protein
MSRTKPTWILRLARDPEIEDNTLILAANPRFYICFPDKSTGLIPYYNLCEEFEEGIPPGVDPSLVNGTACRHHGEFKTIAGAQSHAVNLSDKLRDRKNDQ